MKDKYKVDAIKEICESILNDDSIIYHKATMIMILKSILEVCNG